AGGRSLFWQKFRGGIVGLLCFKILNTGPSCHQLGVENRLFRAREQQMPKPRRVVHRHPNSNRAKIGLDEIYFIQVSI
ncbi:hypothetical protein C0J52_12595, partial [Blattella germanica]